MQEPVPSQANSIEREAASEKTASNLLSQLLEGSLSPKKGTLSEEEWTCLREVVKRPGGTESTFEEMATGLVQAFLKVRLANNFKNQESLATLSATIAKTLCSDPTACQRLLEFQKHLNGQA